MIMRTVEDFYYTPTVLLDNYLTHIFTQATRVDNANLFSSIYVPVYPVTSTGMSDTVSWYNVGLTPAQIAQIYYSQYSKNYLLGAGRGKTIDDDSAKVINLITAQFLKNLYKYKKSIELLGYEYNPLWNVDGTELHQLSEKHGDEVVQNSDTSHELDYLNNTTTHNTAPYNSTGTKTEWDETVSGGQEQAQAPSATATVGSNTVTSTGAEIGNIGSGSSIARSNVSAKTHNEFSYAILAKDAAFGGSVETSDILHTEKTVRQGNIGVTKTTELIEDQRKILKYSLIQEFFNDINEVVLIGLYDI